MNELKFIDTPELKFYHTSKGVIAKYKKKKFILGTQFNSLENFSFTEDDYLNLSQLVLDYESSVRGFPKHQLTTKKLISSTSFTNDYSPFYKYVKPSIFNYYILKGKWQLGNIHQYRTIENINQRDEYEGYSFLNLNINNHMVSQVCNSGFNYLIFCGTKSNNSSTHKEQFGQKELYIPDTKSFAESICKSINAKRYFIQNVKYSTLKSYVSRQPIINPNIKINNILTPPYFDVLAEHMLYPSLFVKPESFEVENEVRIIFEMEKDHFKPYKFKNTALLEHIKY